MIIDEIKSKIAARHMEIRIDYTQNRMVRIDIKTKGTQIIKTLTHHRNLNLAEMTLRETCKISITGRKSSLKVGLPKGQKNIIINEFDYITISHLSEARNSIRPESGKGFGKMIVIKDERKFTILPDSGISVNFHAIETTHEPISNLNLTSNKV